MKFVKFIKRMKCELVEDEDVDVLLYKDVYGTNVPYTNCSRCGKPIKKTMYVVQGVDTAIEHFYLGSCCYKKL